MFNDVTRYYMNAIKQYGFQYSKDDLGYYFDNGKSKYSIMKHGPIFQCYLNIKVETNWVLIGKSNGILEFNECLKWVMNSIQKQK